MGGTERIPGERTLRTPAKTWLQALETSDRLTADPLMTLPARLDVLAETYGEAPALLGDKERLSYAELGARARRYARWAAGEGLGPGHCVALLMPNRPEFVALWMGLTRRGVVVALLNTQLPAPALAHCLKAVRPDRLVADAALADRLQEAMGGLLDPRMLWRHGGGASDRRIDWAAETLSGGPLTGEEAPKVRLSDTALQIYTSGTTGLPKAANVSHRRLLSWSGWFAGMMDAGPADRLYNCLPLYHSVGGVAAVGALLVSGGSVVVADRFSARRFWSDIVQWDCTLVQYIGELCRYLLVAPAHPDETRHRLRLACGNGLRADVWTPFQERFKIPRILEFYASTEGNFSLFNVEGRPGAVGRIPPVLRHRFPLELVAFDVDAGLPRRGADGFCLRCAPGETGEAVARLGEGGASNRFEGYSDPAASERKILRDVFEPGDAWYRSGDLMRRDPDGFYIFVDRIGDTFRWKGENVSTGEVAAALEAEPGVLAAAVYGVEVPGADGRAGMASLVVDHRFQLDGLDAALARRLPAYARPVFLRLTSALDLTGTLRPKKTTLVAEGFDPRLASDPIFLRDHAQGEYRRLDAALYLALMEGRVRL